MVTSEHTARFSAVADKELIDILRRKDIGDECVLTVTFRINEVTDDHVSGVMVDAIPEGYEEDADEPVPGEDVSVAVLSTVPEE
jgi:hypothetical protein